MSLDWQTAFSLVAGLATILGLIFSFVAWRRAAGAEVAAGQAREAVRRSNAGEELRELSERAKELLRSAQNDHFEAALLRSTDLLAGIVQASHRWQSLLGDDGSKNMNVAGRKAKKISTALSAGVLP